MSLFFPQVTLHIYYYHQNYIFKYVEFHTDGRANLHKQSVVPYSVCLISRMILSFSERVLTCKAHGTDTF